MSPCEKGGQGVRWNIPKGHGSYKLLHGLHQEARLRATGDVSPVDLSSRLKGIPNTPSTTPTPHPMVGSLCMFLRAKVGRESLYRQLVSTCRKLAPLCSTGRKHTNLSIQHYPGESKRETFSTWPG